MGPAMTPLEAFSAQPAHLKAWLLWLFTINASSLFFARYVEARWVLAAMVANLASMMLLLNLYGGGHHMGIPHVVFWTPLLGYLVMRRKTITKQTSPYAAWVALLFVTDAISLVMDYATLAKWAFA